MTREPQVDIVFNIYLEYEGYVLGNAIDKNVHVGEEIIVVSWKGKNSQSNPYEGGNMHRVMWKLKKLSFYENGKLSIA